MTTSYSTYYKLPKPAFDTPLWHTLVNQMIDQVDTALQQLLTASQIAAWAVSTAYTIGDMAIDETDATTWICLVAHTSDTGTFAADRTANPTYWSEFAVGFRVRGAWANDTAYKTNDIVFEAATGIAAICTTAHTSSSSPATIDTDTANWDYLIDFSEVANAVAVSYDNSDSDLTATNVKAALDELAAENIIESQVFS